MFGIYLRRELLNRRKQTIIIAIGMALAIALVIVVNAVSAGVKDAQAHVLQSVYGVGTAVTITKPVSTSNNPTVIGAGVERRIDPLVMATLAHGDHVEEGKLLDTNGVVVAVRESESDLDSDPV